MGGIPLKSAPSRWLYITEVCERSALAKLAWKPRSLLSDAPRRSARTKLAWRKDKIGQEEASLQMCTSENTAEQRTQQGSNPSLVTSNALFVTWSR